MKWYSFGYLAGLSSLNFIHSAKMVVGQLVISLSLVILYWIGLNYSLINYRYLQPIKLLVSFIVGILFAALSAQLWLSFSQDTINKPQIRQVEGLVCSIPQKLSEQRPNQEVEGVTVKFDFCVSKLSGSKLSPFQNSKLKLSYYRLDTESASKLIAGSHWHLTVKLKPIYGRLNPVGFDYKKWLISEGYLATGYIKEASLLDTSFSLRAYYHRARQSIYQAVSEATGNQNTRGVILALAMGERAEIDPTQWRFIVDSGTAHLLAISGLHIGIAALWGYYIFLFIFKNLTWITRRYSAQRLAEFFSLISALLVTLVSGLGYPSQRALIMLSIFLCCRWSGRNLTLANLLGLSVIVITILQPFAVMSMSFWLSVYAVAIIAIVISYKQQTNGKLANVKAWLRLNWLLFLGLIPISWWFFSQFSAVGFIANVILIPLTTFISAPLIYIGLVSLIVSEKLAGWVFHWVEYAIALTLWLQEKLAGINDLIVVPGLTMIGGVAIVIAVLVFLLPKFVPGRSLFIPALVLLISTNFKTPDKQKLNLIMFDVGHGLAINVSIDGKQLIYDTGYGRSTIKNLSKQKNKLNSATNKNFKVISDYSVARSSLIPYLESHSVKHIDKLVISHNDADHSGGFIDIIERFTIGELLLGESDFISSKQLELNIEQARVTNIASCHNKSEWDWNGVSFKFIDTTSHFNRSKAPLKQRLKGQSSRVKYKGNNASCVLLIETGNNRLLITGDIEKRVEKELIRADNSQRLVKIDLLVAPHHGSETSSTRDFVNHLNPKIVLFSAGYANQWQFPRKAVVDRYHDIAATQFTSFKSGAITITESANGDLKIETERKRKPRFWHRIQP